MRKTVEVKSQAELVAALQKYGDEARIVCVGSGIFSVKGSAHVEARESAHVVARESAHVVAWGSAHVEAWGSAHVEARESAHVEAWGSAHVVAWESAHVEAWGSAHVVAWESAHVEARESAHVVARESAHVVAWGSAHVEAWGSAHVEARGSAHVVARESAHVVARGSAHVVAGKFCPVTTFPRFAGQVSGGVQIKVEFPTSAVEWCEFYGVQVGEGIATLFKAVGDDYRSPHGVVYLPDTTPSAPDWDGGKEECGGGLHFSPSPAAARAFNPKAKRYVACPVRLSEIAVHPNANYPEKVKAKEVCAPVWECDIYGKPVTGGKDKP